MYKELTDQEKEKQAECVKMFFEEAYDRLRQFPCQNQHEILEGLRSKLTTDLTAELEELNQRIEIVNSNLGVITQKEQPLVSH